MSEIEAKILAVADKPISMSASGYHPEPPPPPWADFSLEDYRELVADLLEQRGADCRAYSGVLQDMSQRYPSEALALCDEIQALPDGTRYIPAIRSGIFDRLTREDIDLAGVLLKKRLATIPGSDRNNAISTVLSGCARKNPGKSFKLFLDLPEEDRSQAARAIGAGIVELDGGKRILATMEETAGKMEDAEAAADLRRSVLSGFGGQINEALGYDQPGGMGADELLQRHRSWLESLDLSPEDCRTLIDGIGSSQQARYGVAFADQSNNGILMDYIAERAGADGADKIAFLMGLWMDGGFSPSNASLKAPLRWLRETPNPVARNAAAPAFIDYAVKKNRPAEGREAAMLMPEGFARDRAIQQIEAAEKANP